MSLRPPRDDDFDEILALMNRHQLAAFGEADVVADELRTWFATPTLDPDRDIRLLARDGSLVGYADTEHAAATDRWWSDVKVDPEVEIDDVLPKLVAWLDERTGSGIVRVWSAAGDGRVVDAYTRLGFAPHRHSYRMEMSLDGNERESSWPRGICVREFTLDDAVGVYEATVEVWRDASDPIEESFDEWRRWTTEREGFDPSLWLLALDGDDLAGMSLCRQDDTDSTAGYVAILGVRRQWRRQGLGEALLLHSFDAFRERGYTRATLGVDASSPTGATRLYERAGMSVYRDTVFLERAARPTSGTRAD
ncbi:MAG: GNAT family N-acetyltransferase [Actinobacteria bacterium]|nr:GNAT family N-acetyltransferase [Actinomycetota bacterium]